MNDYAAGRMREYAAGIQSDDLRLVDEAASSRRSTAPGDRVEAVDGGTKAVSSETESVRAAGTFAPPSGSTQGRAAAVVEKPRADAHIASSDADSPEAAPAATDKFLLAAAKEYDAGIVDQPLWKRAVAQTGGDRTLATQTYLRARATALRVQKREKRQERFARRTRALNELGGPGDAPPARSAAQTQPTGAAARPHSSRPKGKQVMWIGGALASLFAVALLVTVRSESGAAAQQQVNAKPPATATHATSKSSGSAATPAEAQPARGAALEDLIGKIETLKAAGNWNVVVVYAGEWIRHEPNNPLAWRELSNGYVSLGQYRDALDAATRLVQLVPEDAAAWQSLGQIHVALQQPVDALAAFEQAVARNDHDGESIVQMGLVNTQLGRFSDARLAFARAFALNPQDVDALCGAASLAQKEGRSKDAEALTGQVAALDRRCRDATPGRTVRVAVGNNRAAGR
jgi:tetratricopeptide (TPR) repeat protein